MPYQISIKPEQEQAVLKLLQSLMEVGFVESIQPAESLAIEGEPLSDDDLVAILEHRRQEMNEGKSLTQEEVKNLIGAWKSIRQRKIDWSFIVK